MSSRITVLHVLGTGESDAVGIAQTTLHLARHLDHKRWKTCVVFLRGNGPVGDRLARAGAEVRAAGWHGGIANVGGALRFARAVRQTAPAIIHLHAGGRAQRVVARSVSNARIIAHFHSLYEESGSTRERTAAGTDAVIANSAATASTVAGAKPYVVHQGIEVRPRGSPELWGNVRIGVAARLAAVKGLVTLLDAIALINREDPVLAQRVSLEIAGHGSDESLLTAKITELGIGNRVRLLGWRNDIASLMETWDIYVQPSIAEGFGIAILEAMSAGLPVIATDVGGIPELVEHGVTGRLIPRNDVEALAAQIRELASNPELRLSLGVKARARAAREFTIEREVSAIREIYERLLV